MNDPTPGASSLPVDRRFLLGGLAGAAGISALAAMARGGPLTPPGGAVVSSGKTLTEVEPRTMINAANTPGDADSFFKITVPGSYYVTANIVAGVGAKSGIEVAVGGVTIDLCGFEVVGTGAAGGIVSGINVTPITSMGVRVVNGTLRNWGGPGASLGGSGVLEGVRVVACGLVSFQPSLRLNDGCVVTNCTVSGGAYTGIDAGENCVLSHCSSYQCGGDGIQASQGCALEACTAMSCTGTGFQADEGSELVGCSASFNTGHGYRLTGACAHHCGAYNNDAAGFFMNSVSIARGCFSQSNDTGFLFFNGALLQDNLATQNSIGFSTTSGLGSRLEGNYARGNPTGFNIQSPGNFLVRNTAALNSTNNWNVAAGNYCLVVAGVATGAAFTGNSGGASPGSTNPNANYSM